MFHLPVKTNSKPYALILILLLAFLLRMNGLDFGLPYVFHDDEHQYVAAGVAFLQDREATLTELQKLNNPPLFKSALGGLYLLYSYLLIHDPQEIQAAVNDESWRIFFHYAGRFATVSLSLLTVALLYALGKRLYHARVGLLGALLLAISFLHVREAHFAVNDTQLTFLAMAGLYTGAGILRRGRWFDYLATGILIGLAAATKYTGVYLAGVLFLAHGLRSRRLHLNGLEGLRSPRWLSALALVPLGFAIGAPVALTAWPEMLRRMGRLAEYGRLGYHDLLLAPHGSWIFYLETLFWGAGALMFAACLVALLATLIHRSYQDLLLIAFPLLLYAMMGQQEMVFVRFILPALPSLALLVAAWLERFSRFGGHKLGPAMNESRILALATTLLAIQPLAWSLWFGAVLGMPDTREQVAAWLTANIPEGAAIYAETHALPRESVAGRVSWAYVQPTELDFDEPDPLRYYRERGVHFVLTSDFHHERRFTDLAQETGRQKWLKTLAGLNLIEEFQPYWLPGPWFVFDQRYGPWQETLLRQQPGPVIRVYALQPPPDWHGLNPFVEAHHIPDKAAVFGYELTPQPGVLPGQTVNILIYWLNQGWQPANDLIITIVDGAGFEIARAVAQPVADFGEELRLGRKIIKSEANLRLPAGTPPGSYHIRFSVYDQNTLQTLGAIEPAGLAVGESLAVTPISDRPPASGPGLAPGLSLISHELVVEDSAMQNTLAFGQDNWLVLAWLADQDIDLDYTVQLSLLDPQRKAVAVWEGQPVYGSYPTSNWQAGQLVRDPWNLRLPETALTEDSSDETPYHLVLTLLDPEHQVMGVAALDTLRISGHARSSAIPAMQYRLDAVWADAFTLLGFNVRAVPDSPDSGWLELDLYWQSLAPLETDYWVGISLVNEQGQAVLAQEGQPRAGQAPTSAWQPGEVIHDFRSLRYENLAMAEKYRLELTLIDPQTGETLPAAQEGETTPALLLTSWP